MRTILFCLAFLLWLPAAALRAEEGHDRARAAFEAGEIRPLTEILKRADVVQAGQLLEAELEREGGHWVYELKLLSHEGRVVKLFFDASDGQPVAKPGKVKRP